jgi:arylsulfatase A
MSKIKLVLLMCLLAGKIFSQQNPNVIFILVDDLGYGDLSCYGATKIHTPNLDKLAKQGVQFSNAHATSATCTPSRYAIMTGQYPWRKKGTGILPGDAALIVPTDQLTLPSLFKKAGYKTGIVGKWHLGLGDSLEKEWNGELKPGPNEVGFDYSFIFPATADRVPSVFVENHRVVALDATDPIKVDYKQNVGTDPTGKDHPELLKMQSSPGQGHNNTIVNGIGRIGYMSGGNKARWTDEEMPLTFLSKAKEYIETNKSNPFFLYYALTEPHVPRMPSTMFKGKSKLGYRGDAILQLDWTVGEIMKQLNYLNIAENTIIVFSSDNGPVLDDGYQDEAVTKLNGHTPSGVLRGGKYSAFEAGTRVPFIVSWPGKTKSMVSDALICQVDLIHSFSKMVNIKLQENEILDGQDMWDVMLGKSTKGRTTLVEQGINSIAIIQDNWKYIEPNNAPTMDVLTNTELGNNQQPQLYNLSTDISEKVNLAKTHPKELKRLADILQKIKAKN